MKWKRCFVKMAALLVILTDCPELSCKRHFISTWQGAPRGRLVCEVCMKRGGLLLRLLPTLNTLVLPAVRGCELSPSSLPIMVPGEGGHLWLWGRVPCVGWDMSSGHSKGPWPGQWVLVTVAGAHTSWLRLGPWEEKQGPGAHFLAALGGVGDPN